MGGKGGGIGRGWHFAGESARTEEEEEDGGRGTNDWGREGKQLAKLID